MRAMRAAVDVPNGKQCRRMARNLLQLRRRSNRKQRRHSRPCTSASASYSTSTVFNCRCRGYTNDCCTDYHFNCKYTSCCHHYNSCKGRHWRQRRLPRVSCCSLGKMRRPRIYRRYLLRFGSCLQRAIAVVQPMRPRRCSCTPCTPCTPCASASASTACVSSGCYGNKNDDVHHRHNRGAI